MAYNPAYNKILQTKETIVYENKVHARLHDNKILKLPNGYYFLLNFSKYVTHNVKKPRTSIFYSILSQYNQRYGAIMKMFETCKKGLNLSFYRTTVYRNKIK